MAIVFLGEARVGEYQHAVVARVADEAAYALFEGDDGLRQGVVDEGRQAFVGEQAVAGAGDGVVRRGEGQFVDDDADEAVAAHVHAFPEAGGGEQYRAFVAAEVGEQRVFARTTLDEQVVVRVAQGAFGGVQRFVAGEEQEGAAAAARQHRQDGGDERVVVGGIVRVGQAGRVVEQRLVAEVEWALQLDAAVCGEAEFAAVVVEASVDGEGCREECPTGVAVRNPSGEAPGSVDRHRAEAVVARADVQPDGARHRRFVVVFCVVAGFFGGGGGGVLVFGEEGGEQFQQVLAATVEMGEQFAARFLRRELRVQEFKQRRQRLQFCPECAVREELFFVQPCFCRLAHGEEDFAVLQFEIAQGFAQFERVRRFRERRHFAVADEAEQLSRGEAVAEEMDGGERQVVRLVDNKRLDVRQDFRKSLAF